MAPASNEEQFKFLISCIRWSNSGKVDFGEVANECGIVTKGAAAKRYERMMKAHGIAPNAASVKAAPAARAIKTERTKSSTPAKKRKMDDFADEDGAAADDDEIFDNVKADPGSQGEQLHVKQEPSQTFNSPSENHMHFMPSLGAGSRDYSHADGMFEQNGTGFSSHATHGNDGNVYGLQHGNGFMPFSGFEQTAINDSGQPNDQVEDQQEESILIVD